MIGKALSVALRKTGTSLILVLVLVGCGSQAGPASAGRTGRATEADGRHRDMAEVEKSLAKLRQGVDEGEAEVVHAFDVAVGKADPRKTRKKTSAKELVLYLREKKVRLGLGKGVHSRREQFMLDRDALGEFNSGPGQGLKTGERREVLGKYDELNKHLEEAHLAVERTTGGLIRLNMAIMMGSAKLVADRHASGLDLDGKDYRTIAELIAAQRRVETLSAMATGLMAAYHAVVRDGKKPDVIEAYVNETRKAFPTTGAATEEEARAYVASLKKDAGGAKKRYTDWIRDVYGEENLPSMQRGIDDDFAKIAALLSTETKSPSSNGKPPLGSDVRAPSGGLADLLPIDGKAKVAIGGVLALAQGDVKGAINAVTTLVPDGPIKKGLALITALF